MSEIVWEPSSYDLTESQMAVFMRYVNQCFSLQLKSYQELHDWACQNPALFWGEFWAYSEIISSSEFDSVVDDLTMPGTQWFKGALLNYAENCLRFNDDGCAIINANEQGEINRSTYKELHEKVSKCQQFLVEKGIQKNDVVAAVVTNCEETMVLFLAVAAIGAIWTSCSPDFGEDALLSRFSQVNPKCLVFVDSYRFKGKAFSIADKLAYLFKELRSIEFFVQLDRDALELSFSDTTTYSSIQSSYTAGEICFEQLPFNHPLYILYSSGTTGKPKSLVHSAGGALIEHLKEQRLHCDIKREDVFFYYTSCAWMMWNWLVSGLATGCTLVVFDGAPFYPSRMATWEMIDQYNITHYGTSAKFINASSKYKLSPKDSLDLSSLCMILSTGSPLYEDDFDYVYGSVKSTVQLCSISGGTDIVGCFALGNPLLPVYKGELQSISLGCPVQAYDADGAAVCHTKGELVCEGPFPSMPIYFLNDENFDRYKASYFSRYEGIWNHSDFIQISETGSVRVLGRSDATLNRAGIRIGTAEIYQVVDAVDVIQDSLVIHLERSDTMILFIQTVDGSGLTPELNKRLQVTLKEKLSPRHAPNRIYAVPAMPYTKNGKKVELAVKYIFTGEDALINTSSLADVSALDAFRQIKEQAFSTVS